MLFRNRALSEVAECLVSLVPVVTHTGFHQQWHIQAGGGGHALDQAFFDFVYGFFANFDDQFVVDLHGHAGIARVFAA